MTQVSDDRGRQADLLGGDGPALRNHASSSPQARSVVGVAGVVEALLGGDLPVAVTCYDGSRAGPAHAPATLIVRSSDALRRALTALSELGFGRAYVAGDVDVDGDLYAALALGDRMRAPRLSARQRLSVLRLAGAAGPSPSRPRTPRRRRPRERQLCRHRSGLAQRHLPEWAADRQTDTAHPRRRTTDRRLHTRLRLRGYVDRRSRRSRRSQLSTDRTASVDPRSPEPTRTGHRAAEQG